MWKRRVSGLLAGVVLTATAVSARAEDSTSVSASLGWGSGIDDGMGWSLSASGVRGPLFLGLRAGGVEEFVILGPSPAESIRDLGILVGYASNDHLALRYAAVGVGSVRSVRRVGEGRAGLFGSTYERGEKTTIGVPFEFGIVRHGEHFGLGVTASGNLNSATSYVALSLTVHVGQLR